MMEQRSEATAAFRSGIGLAWERVAFVASLIAAVAVLFSAANATAGSAAVALGVGTLVALGVFYALLAWRWDAEWLVYGAECACVGAYLLYRSARPVNDAVDAVVLLLLSFLDFGMSQALERFRLRLYARPTCCFSLVLPLLPLAAALLRGQWDEASMLAFFGAATFYGIACHEKGWKPLGYASAVLYNAFLWLMWARLGWAFAAHPQFYLIPVGLSAILFAEANREDLGRQNVNIIRGLGSMVIYVSTALPMWQFQSFGAWAMLLFLALTGIFAGIALRVQSFLWLGLVCFAFALLYPLSRAGLEHPLARWAIMLGTGLSLVLFVALNEKQRIVATLREYYEEVRGWE
jgi:hypothetical protein